MDLKQELIKELVAAKFEAGKARGNYIWSHADELEFYADFILKRDAKKNEGCTN